MLFCIIYCTVLFVWRQLWPLSAQTHCILARLQSVGLFLNLVVALSSFLKQNLHCLH